MITQYEDWLPGIVRGIYLNHPAKFQLSGIEKKPYLDQKSKYISTLKIQQQKFFNICIIIASDKIKWLKNVVRIPKQF